MKLISSVFFICWVAAPCNVIAKTWNGSASSSWNNALNWTPNGVPISTTYPTIGEDIVFDGSLTPSVTITDYPAVASTGQFGQFTVQNNAALNISGTSNTYMYFGTGILIGAGSTINIGAATTSIFGFGCTNGTAGSSIINGTVEFKGTGTNQISNKKEFKADAGTDATRVFGKIIFSGTAATLTCSSPTLVIKAGGELQWARDGIVMPGFTYEDGATVNVTGVTTTNFRLANFGTYSGVLKWNCPAQTATNLELAPSIGPMIFNLDSVFIMNTGTGSLCMGLQPSYVIGYLEVQGGTVSLSKATSSQTSATILTDFKITGGTVVGNSTFTGDVTTTSALTLNVNRDFIMTGGAFDLTNRPTSPATGAMQLNVSRDFTKTGGTFSCTSAFGSQNEIVMKGSASQNLQFNNLGAGVYALAILNSAATQGVNLQANVTMPPNVPLILLTGAVWLNNFDLSAPYNSIVRIGAARVYTNGYGKLKITTVPAGVNATFPLAALAANSYEPLIVSPVSFAGTHDYSARVEYGNNPSGIYSPNRTIQRTWVVNASPNTGSGQVGLTFQYDDTTKGSACISTAIMEEGHFAGFAWNVDPVVQITPAGSNPYTVGPFYPGGLDSSFVIGNQSSILALNDKVELQLALYNGAAELRWHPDNTNAGYDYFVERSADGAAFTTISDVGNNKFSFTDLSATTTTAYYRIKAIANGGNVLYSNTEKITGMQLSDVIKVYPSLAKNETAVYINSDATGTAGLYIIDVNGRLLYCRNAAVLQGANRLPLNLTAIPAGIYLVNVVVKGKEYFAKLIKE